MVRGREVQTGGKNLRTEREALNPAGSTARRRPGCGHLGGATRLPDRSEHPSTGAAYEGDGGRPEPRDAGHHREGSPDVTDHNSIDGVGKGITREPGDITVPRREEQDMTGRVGSRSVGHDERFLTERGDPDDADRARLTLNGGGGWKEGGSVEPSPEENRENTDGGGEGEKMEYGSLLTGYLMLGIALALMLVSLSIYLWGLDSVFTGKRFPDDIDTPCFLAFLVMGIIFLTLGVVYRDMAVHPELFTADKGGRTEHLRKREEWEAIKRRVKELESGDSEPTRSGDPLDDED